MKKYWHENLRPDVSKELVDEITNFWEDKEMGDGEGNHFMNWNANGYSEVDGAFYKNGKTISVPICRECQVQAPCSKWGGEYPYGRDDGVLERDPTNELIL